MTILARSNQYFFVLALLFLACQGPEPIVRQAAKKYLDARLNDDFSRAMLYASPESYEAIEDLASMTNDYPSTDTLAMQYRITEINISGDSAQVGYELENYFGLEYLRLTKVNEEWLVKLDVNEVPDPAMLARDLRLMEAEDTISKLQRSLDKLLLEEEDSIINQEIIKN